MWHKYLARFCIYTVQYIVFFNYSHDPFNLSFSNFSECGSSSRRLYLLSDLLALLLPVATLWLAEPCSEGIRLPHLQCGYGHGISAHRNVWRQRWVNVRVIFSFFKCFFKTNLVPLPRVGTGIHWSNIFDSVTIDDDFSMAQVMALLLFDSVLYGLVAWYVEAVFPGEYGMPLPSYFFVQVSFNWFANINLEYRCKYSITMWCIKLLCWGAIT